MAEIPSPESIEYQRRSLAMLTVGQPALNREQALKLVEQLADAVDELRRLRRLSDEGRTL
jgi:hypothetical protein